MTTDFDSRTDFDSPSDHDATPGYGEAVAAAREAAGSTSIDGFVERMAERVGAKANVRTVFGEAVERDGITVIPVAKVRWGFGGGAGRGPIAVGPGIDGDAGPSPASIDESSAGSGTGGGGGAIADPIGYIEIGADGATFRAITPPMPSPAFLLAAGITATLVLRGLARLVRR